MAKAAAASSCQQSVDNCHVLPRWYTVAEETVILSNLAVGFRREGSMRVLLAVVVLILLFQLSSLAQEQIDFNINVGGPPAVLEEPPEFVYPPELGFGVAVGIPYDLFYVNGAYFLFRGDSWFKAPFYGGSWTKVGKKNLPRELRKNKIAKIHQYRDREYSQYQKDQQRFPPFRGESPAEEAPATNEQGNSEKAPPAGDKKQEMEQQKPEEKPEIRDEEPEIKQELRKPRPKSSPEVIPI
jgi:hypothetical protein